MSLSFQRNTEHNESQNIQIIKLTDVQSYMHTGLGRWQIAEDNREENA